MAFSRLTVRVVGSRRGEHSRLYERASEALVHVLTPLDAMFACTLRRLKANGPNALTPPQVMPWYLKLLAKFIDPFMILLEVISMFIIHVRASFPQL